MTQSPKGTLLAPAPPPAKNPRPLVVLDLGNYQCTAFDGTKPVTVRSLFVELQPGQQFLKATADSPIIQLGNRRYHVGRKAPSYNGFRAVVSSDKTELARLFLAATVAHRAHGDNTIDLVVLHHSHELVADALKASLLGEWTFTRNNQSQVIHVASVQVVDESLGAFHLLQNRTGWTLGLDIGAGTWLSRVWSQDGETIAALTADKAGTYRLAVAIASDERLKTPLRGRGITRPDTAVILDGLADGSHQYEFSGISWRDWWKEYRREWFLGMLNEAKSQFQPHMGRITQILVTGGGAHLVMDLIEGKPGFQIPQPPHLASVIGTWQAIAGRQP